MDRVKVVHCLGQLNTGGAETLVMNIFRHIDRSKYQFDFLLFNDEKGFYDEEAKSLGANLFYVPSMKKIGIFKYIKQMIIFFKNNDIEIVHSHMDWQGGFIAYAAHKAGIKKIVVHSHANQKMFESNIIYKIIISINKYLIKKYATDCVACSKEAGESLFKKDNEYQGTPIDGDIIIVDEMSMVDLFLMKVSLDSSFIAISDYSYLKSPNWIVTNGDVNLSLDSIISSLDSFIYESPISRESFTFTFILFSSSISVVVVGVSLPLSLTNSTSLLSFP